MIKKIFAGVLLAGVFALLVFGAVNRTLAKTIDQESLALGENQSAGNGGAVKESRSDGEGYGNGTGSGDGVGSSDCDSSSNGSGNSNGGNAGTDSNAASQDGSGAGQANVEEWIVYTGVVEQVVSDSWVIAMENNTTLELDGRIFRYLVEQGFTVSEGDALILTGFYDGDDFEVGEIENVTTGESVLVRDEAGRPLWVGGQHGGWDH